MTTARFNRKGGGYDITITGHADFNPGLDIVCSAVSMLTYTLMQCLKDAEDKGCLTECKMSYQSGDVFISVMPEQFYRKLLENTVDTIITGFELLADKYPDNVKLFHE